MNRNAWLLLGAAGIIAIGTGYFLRKKTSQTDSASNSQLPAENAEANYSVPPSVGVSENPPTQVFDNTTYTMSMGNSLPLSFGPK